MKCLGTSVIWSTSCYLDGLVLLGGGTSIFISACSTARRGSKSISLQSTFLHLVLPLYLFFPLPSLKSLDVSGLFVNVAAKT